MGLKIWFYQQIALQKDYVNFPRSDSVWILLFPYTPAKRVSLFFIFANLIVKSWNLIFISISFITSEVKENWV